MMMQANTEKQETKITLWFARFPRRRTEQNLARKRNEIIEPKPQLKSRSSSRNKTQYQSNSSPQHHSIIVSSYQPSHDQKM